MYQRRVTPQAPEATAQQFGSGVAAAQGDMGQTIGNLGNVLLKAEDAKRTSARNTFYANSTAMLDQKIEEIKFGSDWRAKEGLYKKAIEDMHKQAKDYFGTDQNSYQLWTKDFTPNVIKGETKVMLNRIELMSQEAEVDLDNNLTIFSNQAAQTDNPVEQQIWRQKAHDAIRDDLTNGFINQKEADGKFEKFEENVQSAKIRQLIRVDPVTAYDRLQDPGDPIFGSMKAEKKEIWVARATSAYEQDLRKQDIEERRLERLAAAARKERENELSSEIDVRFSEGTITMDWLTANRNQMNPTDFRYAVNKLDSGIDATTNNTAFVSLSTRIADGEDVSREIDNALINGDIDRSYHQTLRAQMQTEFDPVFKESMNYLRGHYAGEEVIELGERTRLANAIKELNDYRFENPAASRDQYYKKADEILKRWSFNPAQIELFSLPRLVFSEAKTVQTPDEIPIVALKTKQAFDNGDISKEIYLREVELLKKYQRIFGIINSAKEIQ